MKPLAVVIIAILAAGAGFFGGTKYQQAARQQTRGDVMRQSQNGANGQQGTRRMIGRPVVGEVLKTDGKTMTVKMADGTSRIVVLSASTTYSKTAEGAAGDIAVGATVGVFGADNTDGSMTAQNVQLNPSFRMGGGTVNGGQKR